MAYEPGKIMWLESNSIRISHPELPEEPATYLTVASNSAVSSLTVADNSSFLDNDLVLLGLFGQQTAEIVQLNGTPTRGTSLVLDNPATGTYFPHSVNTSVRRMLFNRVEISGASTATGNKTVIATVDLDVSSLFTEYVVSGTTYNFYFVRYYNSLAAVPYYGEYSDPVPSSSFEPNTVGYIIKTAFENMGQELRPDGHLSRSWAYRQIYQGEQDVEKRMRKWSFMQEFDYDAGNATEGLDYFALPSNISNANTPRAILGVRLSTNTPLSPISKTEFQSVRRDVARTTVATTFTDAATSIILTDSRDFADTGTIRIGSDTISYTGNTRSTNTLTGVTGIATGGHSAGDLVWQNATFGVPRRYTVYEGNLYFDVPCDSSLEGRNMWLDYYKKITAVSSDTDTITVSDPTVIRLWLEMQIKRVRNNGELPVADPTRVDYETAVNKMISTETSGQKTYFVPDVEDVADYGYIQNNLV